VKRELNFNIQSPGDIPAQSTGAPHDWWPGFFFFGLLMLPYKPLYEVSIYPYNVGTPAILQAHFLF
jgi:hypothetical protein